MKLLAVFTFCLSLNLVASEIVPSISRSKVSRYDGMISKSWKQSGNQVMIGAGEGEGDRSASKFLTPYIEFNSENMNFNGSYKSSSSKASDVDWESDTNTYQLEFGAKINSETTIAAAYYGQTNEEIYGLDDKYDRSKANRVLRLGVSQKNDNLYYGIGVDSITTEYENPYTRWYGLGPEIDKRRRYLFGGGLISIDQRRSLETVVAYTKTGDSDINHLQATISMTQLYDRFEVNPSLVLGTNSSLLARVASSYMLTNSLFVAPVLRYEKNGLYGKKEMAGILGAGMRGDKFEIELKYRDTLSSSINVSPYQQFSLELVRLF